MKTQQLRYTETIGLEHWPSFKLRKCFTSFSFTTRPISNTACMMLCIVRDLQSTISKGHVFLKKHYQSYGRMKYCEMHCRPVMAHTSTPQPVTCYVGVAAARSMREQKISSLISCAPGTSDITHVSSVLSRVSRQIGHVLLFTFLHIKHISHEDSCTNVI